MITVGFLIMLLSLAFSDTQTYKAIDQKIARLIKDEKSEWITAPDSYEIICSKCECEAFSDYGEYIKTDYCPNCGKKMKGADDDTD